MPSDHEIWRSLPRSVRNSAVELISELESRLAEAPKDSQDEKVFHDEVRSALIVAIGVLAEAGHRGPVTLSSREGNA